MTIDINLTAQQIFANLSKKDGIADNKIGLKADNTYDNSIWNSFAEVAGGKQIINYIEQGNALKSIRTYLQRAINDVTRFGKIAAAGGVTISSDEISAASIPTEETVPTQGKTDSKEIVKAFLNPQISETDLDTIAQKYDAIVKYNQENGIPVTDNEGNITNEIKTRLINYASALEFYAKENEMAELYAKDLSSEKAQLEQAGINSESLAEMLEEGEITQDEYDNNVKILNYNSPNTSNLTIVNNDVKEAVDAGSEEKFKAAFHQAAKEFIELYDNAKGDGKISIEELLTFEENKLGRKFTDKERNNATAMATNLFAMIDIGKEDSYLDKNEVAAYLWAMSKINDSEGDKTAHDITYDEWKYAQDSIAFMGIPQGELSQDQIDQIAKFSYTIENGYAGLKTN